MLTRRERLALGMSACLQMSGHHTPYLFVLGVLLRGHHLVQLASRCLALEEQVVSVGRHGEIDENARSVGLPKADRQQITVPVIHKVEAVAAQVLAQTLHDGHQPRILPGQLHAGNNAARSLTHEP